MAERDFSVDEIDFGILFLANLSMYDAENVENAQQAIKMQFADEYFLEKIVII